MLDHRRHERWSVAHLGHHDATRIVDQPGQSWRRSAEDSALIREGLARLIVDSGGVVVAKVGDGPSFVAAVVEHRPDVSVVDVRMPPTQRDEGLRAAIEARRLVPGTPSSSSASTSSASTRPSCSRTGPAASATS